MKYWFLQTCVGWPMNDVSVEGGLSDMIDSALGITRRTFLLHVDQDELKGIEAKLGYASHHKQGLTMAADWHVSYHRGTLHEERVYFFSWSGIEHVFTAG